MSGLYSSSITEVLSSQDCEPYKLRTGENHFGVPLFWKQAPQASQWFGVSLNEPCIPMGCTHCKAMQGRVRRSIERIAKNP